MHTMLLSNYIAARTISSPMKNSFNEIKILFSEPLKNQLFRKWIKH